MQPYVTWTPKYDGNKPPYWREDMLATIYSDWEKDCCAGWKPFWNKGEKYLVERAAVHPDAMPAQIQDALYVLRQFPADELAKHGVTLEPERDWAADLFAEAYRICNGNERANYNFDERDLEAIEYIRNNAKAAVMTGELREFDPARYIKTGEDMSLALNAALDGGDLDHLKRTFELVARVHNEAIAERDNVLDGLKQIARSDPLGIYATDNPKTDPITIAQSLIKELTT